MRRILPALFLLALAACRSTEETSPPAPAPPPPPPAVGAAALDKTVVVTPPERKVPKRYAEFSGVWVGTWDGTTFDGRLAVRSVAANGTVEVTYAWGTFGDIRPGTADGRGKISGDRLRLDRFANGGDAIFTMQPDGTLAGTYAVGEQKFAGVFRKE